MSTYENIENLVTSGLREHCSAQGNTTPDCAKARPAAPATWCAGCRTRNLALLALALWAQLEAV